VTIIATELIGSTKFSQDGDGGRQGQRGWIVYDDEGGMIPASEVMVQSGMPDLGSEHPEITGLYAGSWNIELSDDRPDTWNVIWNYSSAWYNIGDDDEDDDEGLGGGNVSGYNMTVGLTIIDIWKADPNIPTGGSLSDPPRTDIGGTLVSEGGYPISMALPTADIRIREQFSGFFQAGQILTNVGKRNSHSWQGFAKGSVLFTGMNVNHTREGVNEIEYTLAWDTWYHLRQTPERDADGNPVVDTSADPPTVDVYFKQPFKATTSFAFLPM